MTSLRHLRSSTANKRPDPTAMVDGQLAMNYDIASPGLFFKDDNGTLIKVGPVHVGTTAPNVSPAAGGTAGNSVGEQWLDTTGGVYVLKVWDGSAWRSESGTFVDVSGDTMTGALTMANQGAVRFSETTANGSNYIALQANAALASNKTITLPDTTGTVVTTGDTGTVTSTMIADGTILNADVNASAAIAGSKISPDFGSQTVATTGILSTGTGSAAAPSIAFTGDTNTGIYSPGADQLAVSTGGTGRLFVDSSGNVGIGTASPNANLHIAGPTAPLLRIGDFDNSRTINSEIRLNRAGGAQPFAKLSFYNGSASTAEAQIFKDSNGLTTLSDVQIFLSAASSEYMRIDSSGRLGIGTSSPQVKLHIYNTGVSGTAYQPAVFIRNDSGGGNANNPTGLGAINWQTEGYDVANIEAVRDLPNAGSFSSLVFRTNAGNATTGAGTERMRITSVGTVNTFSSTTDAFVSRSSSAAGTTNYNIRCTYAATGALDGTVAFQVSTNGNVTNTNNSYGAISDVKLKENIVDATSQWNDIKALQVRKYNFKEGQTHTQIGLVAQEVELVSPGLVTESPDRDEDGNDLGTVTKGVNYSVLYMKAVKALQEAMERIETLEAAVAALQQS